MDKTICNAFHGVLTSAMVRLILCCFAQYESVPEVWNFQSLLFWDIYIIAVLSRQEPSKHSQIFSRETKFLNTLCAIPDLLMMLVYHLWSFLVTIILVSAVNGFPFAKRWQINVNGNGVSADQINEYIDQIARLAQYVVDNVHPDHALYLRFFGTAEFFDENMSEFLLLQSACY